MVCGVYPTENSNIHSLFVENSQAARPGALSAPRNRDLQARTLRGHHAAETPARANLTANTRGWLAYSLMSRSCAGGIRGGDGDTMSPPVTVS